MTTQPLGTPALEASSPCYGGASASVDESGPASDASDSASRHDFSAHQVSRSEAEEKNAADEDDDSGDEFEFTFAVRDADAFPAVAADDIFSGGRIIPTYPVFNRDLLLPLSAADEPTIAETDPPDQIPFGRLLIEEKVTGAEEPAAAGDHFPGAPDRCKKSASTGSSMQWRLRDTVGRSHSDGKEKFVFLEAATAKKNAMSPNATRAAAGGKRAKEGGRLPEADAVTAHRRFHGKGTSEKTVKGPRRSFLPYRQQLLGLFAPVNGLRRSHHPF